MIGFILLGTNDVERAGRFYDALLGEIGANRAAENANSIHWRAPSGEVTLAVHSPHDGRPATWGNGTMIAIAVNNREEVDALHAKALELGAKDEGAPARAARAISTAHTLGISMATSWRSISREVETTDGTLVSRLVHRDAVCGVKVNFAKAPSPSVVERN